MCDICFHLGGNICFLLVGDMPSVLEDTKKELCKLSEDVHKFSFDIVFATLRGYLADVCHMEVRPYFQICAYMYASLIKMNDFVTKSGNPV